MADAKQILLVLMEQNGPKHLEKQPYAVYEALIAGGLPAKQARLILITLLAGAASDARKMSAEQLANNLQRSCALRKSAGAQTAALHPTFSCRSA